MRRIKLTVAYDGTRYCGWQVQKNGVSIQKTLQNAIEKLLGESIDLSGASRTDSGVHALGQVAIFDTDSDIPPERFAMAINQKLPDDIVVQSSEEVDPSFHPRYADIRKTYEYRILNRRIRQPFERNYAHFVPSTLDIDAMKSAARLFVGEHDFRSFCSQRTEVATTVRKIFSLDVEKEGDIIRIKVCGNGFLYNMVRIISGMLIKIGMGQRTEEDIIFALENPGSRAAAPTAPAKGLCLVSIEYLG